MRAWTIQRRHRSRLIRRMYGQDEEFRELWDDYLSARKAHRHFEAKGDSERSKEYFKLCDELAEEVRDYFERQK